MVQFSGHPSGSSGRDNTGKEKAESSVRRTQEQQRQGERQSTKSV